MTAAAHDLPIYAVQPAIVDALRRGNRLVLSAPTGSGKTTQVPQMLLRHNLVQGQIIVLQPRRLAARLVARRVAAEMETPPGELVGYQTRIEKVVSPRTILRFVTEGLFLRQLQSEPHLPGVGAVIFDEFHERSLIADASLALVRRLQETRRPDLKLVVMSATLDVQLVSKYLACPIVESGGRTFPIDIQYLPQRPQKPIWDVATEVIGQVLREHSANPGGGGGGNSGGGGDVLVFMPGAYEIRRTLEVCQRRFSAAGDALAFFPLHGELPPAQQDAAVSPSPKRKVIVSTNVAETSITIPGVRHVVDSGQARVHRYDPRRGVNTLELTPISRASADQRAGRAGRTAPGTCHRLWSQMEHRGRAPAELPEIKRLDLAEVALHLLSMGITDLATFAWLEPPEEASLRQALDVLRLLDAIDDRQQLTPLGATMAPLPVHPRLARLLAAGAQQGCLDRAATWAALVSERDIFTARRSAEQLALARSWGEEEGQTQRSDLVVLERALESAHAVKFDPRACSDMGIHGAAAREVDHARRQLRDACRDLQGRGKSASADSTRTLIDCVLRGFPDHLAARLGAGEGCAVIGNRRGVLAEESVARRPGALLAIEMRETTTRDGMRTVLDVVSEIDLEQLRAAFPQRLRETTSCRWNPQKKAVEQVRQVLLDDLAVAEATRDDPDPAQAADLLAQMIERGEIKLERWDESVEQWLARTRCVAAWFPERKLLTYDEDDLRVIRQEICDGKVRLSQLADAPVLDQVKNALSWDDQQFVERMAPPRLQLPGGWGMKIEYQVGAPPRGRGKIQDFYGLDQSPTVAAGRQRLLLEILAPNFRPVQVTDDLANFWKTLYPEIKPALQRRYPRQQWR